MALERDHLHLKQWLAPLREFKQTNSADTLSRDHALVRSLR